MDHEKQPWGCHALQVQPPRITKVELNQIFSYLPPIFPFSNSSRFDFLEPIDPSSTPYPTRHFGYLSHCTSSSHLVLSRFLVPIPPPSTTHGRIAARLFHIQPIVSKAGSSRSPKHTQTPSSSSATPGALATTAHRYFLRLPHCQLSLKNSNERTSTFSIVLSISPREFATVLPLVLISLVASTINPRLEP